MDNAERNFWRSSSANTLLTQGHLEHIAQGHAQAGFEDLQV